MRYMIAKKNSGTYKMSRKYHRVSHHDGVRQVASATGNLNGSDQKAMAGHAMLM